MMQGFDKAEALAFILKGIHAKDHPELAGRLEDMISRMIDADLGYMHEAGVLNEDGTAGNAYYDEDDAIEFIVDRIVNEGGMSPEEAISVAALADDYLDLQEAYLTHIGLVDWD